MLASSKCGNKLVINLYHLPAYHMLYKLGYQVFYIQTICISFILKSPSAYSTNEVTGVSTRETALKPRILLESLHPGFLLFIKSKIQHTLKPDLGTISQRLVWLNGPQNVLISCLVFHDPPQQSILSAFVLVIAI